MAIIGCGPVGITLAGLLGREGLRVAVFDRAHEVYAQPRAVGFDHDAMRLFQRIGAAEALAPHVTDFRNTVYRGVDGQVIQRVRRIEPPYPYTWAPNVTSKASENRYVPSPNTALVRVLSSKPPPPKRSMNSSCDARKR